MSLSVTVVTQDDPFYVPRFFERFFEESPDEVTVERVVVLPSFNESFPDLVSRMYRFYGPLNFVRRGLSFAFRTALDTVGRGSFSVERVARAHGIETEYRETVNDESFLDHASTVDVVLSVSAPELFDDELLDAPQWGCLNVHTARLPEYRGMMPTFWALYHGDDEVGVTVHTMTSELDRGEAVIRRSFPVHDDDTLDNVIIRGKVEGSEAAVEALEAVENGTVESDPIDGEGSYFSFPTRDERREFQRRGWNLL